MTDHRIFELRTYHAAPGKLDALHQRFQNHTFDIFARHGMELVAFLAPTDEPDRSNTLVYLLAFPDRESGTRAWDDFRADRDWIAAKAASEIDGPLVDRVDSIYLEGTAASPLR